MEGKSMQLGKGSDHIQDPIIKDEIQSSGTTATSTPSAPTYPTQFGTIRLNIDPKQNKQMISSGTISQIMYPVYFEAPTISDQAVLVQATVSSDQIGTSVGVADNWLGEWELGSPVWFNRNQMARFAAQTKKAWDAQIKTQNFADINWNPPYKEVFVKNQDTVDYLNTLIQIGAIYTWNPQMTTLMSWNAYQFTTPLTFPMPYMPNNAWAMTTFYYMGSSAFDSQHLVSPYIQDPGQIVSNLLYYSSKSSCDVAVPSISNFEYPAWISNLPQTVYPSIFANWMETPAYYQVITNDGIQDYSPMWYAGQKGAETLGLTANNNLCTKAKAQNYNVGTAIYPLVFDSPVLHECIYKGYASFTPEEAGYSTGDTMAITLNMPTYSYTYNGQLTNPFIFGAINVQAQVQMQYSATPTISTPTDVLWTIGTTYDEIPKNYISYDLWGQDKGFLAMVAQGLIILWNKNPRPYGTQIEALSAEVPSYKLSRNANLTSYIRRMSMPCLPFGIKDPRLPIFYTNIDLSTAQPTTGTNDLVELDLDGFDVRSNVDPAF